jgi:transmembrane sensor
VGPHVSVDREKPALDEVAVARLWAGIGARRRSRAQRRRTLTAVAGAALVTMVMLLVLRPSRLPPQEMLPLQARAVTPSGPLHLETGAIPGVLSAKEAPLRVALDDGSVVELARGAALDTQVNTAAAFTGHLLGSATFEVKPGGARRWSIVTSLVTVDVIGTRFQVLAEGDALRVVVEHGIVLVRGEHVPGQVQRLVDGQSLRVSAETAAWVPVTPSAPSAPTPTTQAPPPPPEHAPASPRSVWKDLARSGDYDAAYRQLGPDGVAREAARASVDDLMMLADVARLSAHGADAVVPLSHVVDEHAADARAAVAAFTLGRLQLDTLNHPGQAAKAFARAIALGLPGSLVEDAYARLVEADAKAGNRDAARAAADEYARKFPQGTRSSSMAKWVAGGSSEHP